MNIKENLDRKVSQAHEEGKYSSSIQSLYVRLIQTITVPNSANFQGGKSLASSFHADYGKINQGGWGLIKPPRAETGTKRLIYSPENWRYLVG